MSGTPVRTTKFWTYNVTSSLTISEDDGLSAISILLISGTGTVTGTVSVNGKASVALALQSGVSVTYESKPGTVISGLVITASGGTVQLTGYQ